MKTFNFINGGLKNEKKNNELAFSYRLCVWCVWVNRL